MPCWMVSMPPLFSRVYKIRMAPKTIINTPTATTTPCRESASRYMTSSFQPIRPQTAQASQATGMARVAGQRMPTIRTRAATMGMTASNASIPIDMKTSLLG